MTSSQKDAQHRLRDKYNITFDGPIDSIRKPHWPKNSDTVFHDVRRLGRTDVHEFRESINADSRRHPWRENVQRRADRVAEQAQQCLNTRKNELGWRLNLEHAIMGRFSVEVACPNCRGRLWRSEVEVMSNNLDDENGVNSLKSRQQRRQPCACDRGRLGDDLYENGISALFDNTADETIEYPSSVQADLPKRERPDRVYGLRPGKRLASLLKKVDDSPLFSDCDSDEKVLKKSPFQERSSILFPFLILEAKSHKSLDSFDDIQGQTAFGIRELLCIQDQLGQAAGEDETWDAGPLVWFLSNKGEQWKVSAAFIQNINGEKFYRVVQLWNGGVNSREHALQLLLILDYIVDWARDLYREGVAQSLKRIACDDSRTITCDTDVYSLSGKVRDWAFADDNEGTEYDECQYVSGDPLRAFDSSSGVFRDARFIRTRFIGLYVTEENVDHLINCTPSHEASQKLMRSLLDSLEESCRVRRDVLDEIEMSWTNKSREGSDMTPPDEIFFVSITALWYFTPEWEQTRELSYLAISESLLDRLVQVAGIDKPSNRVLSRIPLVSGVPSFDELLNRDAVDNLSACASRACIYTRDVSGCKGSNNLFTWRSLQNEASGKPSFRHVEIGVRDGPRSKAREFVFDLYLKHRIGRNEPTSPIFRLSSRLDELAPLKDLFDRQEMLSEEVWPWTNSFPELRDQDVVVAVSKSRQAMNHKANLCLFIMDPSALERGVPCESLEFTPPWHLCVKIFDKKDGWERGWNLKHVLSRNSKDTRLANELRSLVSHLKTTKYEKRPQWDVLTQGGVTFEGLDDFAFDIGSPYRRREWQEKLQVPPLKLQDSSGEISGLDVIIIDDDEPQIISCSPSKSLSKNKSPSHSSQEQQKLQPDTCMVGNSQPSSSAAEQTKAVVAETPHTPNNPTPKRAREYAREDEEAESSARAERRQQLADEMFARDFLSDDEFEELMRTGTLV